MTSLIYTLFLAVVLPAAVSIKSEVQGQTPSVTRTDAQIEELNGNFSTWETSAAHFISSLSDIATINKETKLEPLFTKVHSGFTSINYDEVFDTWERNTMVWPNPITGLRKAFNEKSSIVASLLVDAGRKVGEGRSSCDVLQKLGNETLNFTTIVDLSEMGFSASPSKISERRHAAMAMYSSAVRRIGSLSLRSREAIGCPMGNFEAGLLELDKNPNSTKAAKKLEPFFAPMMHATGPASNTYDTGALMKRLGMGGAGAQGPSASLLALVAVAAALRTAA